MKGLVCHRKSIVYASGREVEMFRQKNENKNKTERNFIFSWRLLIQSNPNQFNFQIVTFSDVEFEHTWFLAILSSKSRISRESD